LFSVELPGWAERCGIPDLAPGRDAEY